MLVMSSQVFFSVGADHNEVWMGNGFAAKTGITVVKNRSVASKCTESQNLFFVIMYLL
jgi:hypothetical protein